MCNTDTKYDSINHTIKNLYFDTSSSAKLNELKLNEQTPQIKIRIMKDIKSK